jgi:protein-S-isoprenylcysteine O-methyltransferase Ste14
LDIALVVLHVSFIAPLVIRLLGLRPTPDHSQPVAERSASASRSYWVLLVHGVGLLGLYAGLALALAKREIAREVSLRGLMGAALVLLAVALICWALLVFRSWRLLPKVEEGHQLCTAGPFGLVRHPIYLALDLLGVGSVMWVGTPLVIVGAIFLVVGGDLRARKEEQLLLQAFGDDYRDYARRVRRLLPGLY